MNIEILAFGLPGGTEWIIVGVVALLVFGRRLPDVARSVGKSIVEFKKGIRDVNDDIESQSRLEAPKPPKLEDRKDATNGASPANGGQD